MSKRPHSILNQDGPLRASKLGPLNVGNKRYSVLNGSQKPQLKLASLKDMFSLNSNDKQNFSSHHPPGGGVGGDYGHFTQFISHTPAGSSLSVPRGGGVGGGHLYLTNPEVSQ